MKTKGFTPEFDDYMAKCAEFAQPVMAHLREVVHKTCPDVVEKIKWRIPHFDYKGETLCVFAAYKKHCSFTFLKQELMSDPKLQANPRLQASKRYMGNLTSVSDLPSRRQLIAYIKEAMRLNENGIKPAPRTAASPKEIVMPNEFAKALKKHPKANSVFESKSNSFRKEYLVWIADAKTEATRKKRIDEALSWIAEGKGRFWKYTKAKK